jgi:hypothetical protein
MPWILTGVGVLILAVAVWSRLGRRRAARWWVGDRVNENAVLFWLPGIALILIAAGPLSTYDDSPQRWVFWFVPVLLAGAVLSLWGGLFLPVPRWYAPGWTHDGTRTILQARVTGLRNERERRGT